MALDVDLADRFADRAVDQRDAALPAIALLLDAARASSKEIEVRVVEGLGQKGRVVHTKWKPDIPSRSKRQRVERSPAAVIALFSAMSTVAEAEPSSPAG